MMCLIENLINFRYFQREIYAETFSNFHKGFRDCLNWKTWKWTPIQKGMISPVGINRRRNRGKWRVAVAVTRLICFIRRCQLAATWKSLVTDCEMRFSVLRYFSSVPLLLISANVPVRSRKSYINNWNTQKCFTIIEIYFKFFYDEKILEKTSIPCFVRG